jgi:hypothetical protein
MTGIRQRSAGFIGPLGDAEFALTTIDIWQSREGQGAYQSPRSFRLPPNGCYNAPVALFIGPAPTCSRHSTKSFERTVKVGYSNLSAFWTNYKMAIPLELAMKPSSIGSYWYEGRGLVSKVMVTVDGRPAPKILAG